jgi:hypothetical protein
LINNGDRNCQTYQYGTGGPLFVDPKIYDAAVKENANICAVLTLGNPGEVGVGDVFGHGTSGQTPGHILSIIKTLSNTYSIGFGYGRTGYLSTFNRGDIYHQQVKQGGNIVQKGGNIVQKGGGVFKIIQRNLKKLFVVAAKTTIKTGDICMGFMPYGKKLTGKFAKVFVPKIAVLRPSIWDGVHNDLQGSIGGPDFTWSEKFNKYPAKFPGLQIVNNMIYKLDAVNGNDVHIVPTISQSSSSTSLSTCDNNSSFNKGLGNVFAVQMHKIHLVYEPNVGIFFIAPRAYNFLTSNNYSALACVPRGETFTCGSTLGINCSGWQLGLFGGIISLNSSDGALCTPNNPQPIVSGTVCNGNATFGGKKTRRKKRKKGKQTKKNKI